MRPPATVAATASQYHWISLRIMADAPNQTPYNPYSPTSPEERADESASHRHSRLGVPEGPPSRTPSPTQYEFIMTTGDESATTARQKLKTVRSHVMKNYLQQQQRQGASRESLSVASSERRKGKQRARSSRSASREVEHSPTVSEKGHSASAEIGSLFSGFALTDPFASAGTEERSSLGKSMPYAPRYTKRPYRNTFFTRTKLTSGL